ncbi:hypothetical protein ACJJTC_019445 [Scirpophaga incertulas]
MQRQSAQESRTREQISLVTLPPKGPQNKEESGTRAYRMMLECGGALDPSWLNRTAKCKSILYTAKSKHPKFGSMIAFNDIILGKAAAARARLVQRTCRHLAQEAALDWKMGFH